MKIKLDKPINPNYCATIVKIERLVELPNCDRVQAAIVFGNSIIVSKDIKRGDHMVFFPIECKLSHEYLSTNNLYRHAEKNVDTSKFAFFEDNGRVKCARFRGHKSEGFLMPVVSLVFALGLSEYDEIEVENALPVDSEFDKINNIEICQKYVVPTRNPQSQSGKEKNSIKRISRLVENQMRLHGDTYNARKNVHNILPNDITLISNKIHGTSGVFAHLLVKRKLGLLDRICKFFGANIIETEYGYIRASRKVIKDQYLADPKNVGGGFYGYDLWEDVSKEVNPCLEKGISLYMEIFGYTKTGGYIQKDYDYRCEPTKYKFAIYRATSTNIDGCVLEMDWPRLKEYCSRYGLPLVPEYYYGQAKDLFNIPVNEEWNEKWLAQVEEKYVNDKKCDICINDVPKEGVVIRVEKTDQPNEFIAYKSKNFKFLERETKLNDDGIIDMETEQSIEKIEINKIE